MGLVEILWTVAGILVPLLLGTAWAMIGLTPPEFWIARGCIILAAIIFAGVSLFWVVQSPWPNTARAIMAAVLGAVTLIVFSEALRWVNVREAILAPKNPTAVNIDYAYSLVFEGLQGGLDFDNKENTLEVRPIFGNVSGSPLKFQIKELKTTIEGKSVTSHGSGIIAKDGHTTFFSNSGFSGEVYNSFPERTMGQLTYQIEYGHPDLPPSRLASKTVRIDLFKKKDKKKKILSVNWTVVSDTDEPLKK
jgi:hypothetical protein